MSKQDNSGPAFPCARCDLMAVRRSGNQMLCAMHYRFGSMRATAGRDGKTVPSHQQLAAMVMPSNACHDCGVHMPWLASEGACTVATLQHYRDGTFGLVCRSCNSRHAAMPGDTYRQIDKGDKFCPSCRAVKPSAEFYSDASRTGALRRKSHCTSCSAQSIQTWRESNREKYNEYQRAYRAKRKAAGDPVSRGT
jgi:hypothetical protein